ncbi:MAG: glycosyltransferase family 9 protein [Bacteroidota bacterium]
MDLLGLKYVNIVSWGGMGDALLSTASFKAIKEKYPDKKIRVFYLKRHRDIFLNNPYIDSLVEASFKGAPMSWVLNYFGLIDIKSINYSFTKPSRNYDKSIISVIGEMLDVESKPEDLSLYLTEEEKQAGKDILREVMGKVIAIAPYTISSENKLWVHSYWEELIEQMPDYTFIQLGVNQEPLVNGALDLRGLKLRESMAVMNQTDGFVGVDSFLAHVATALDIPSVVLFGATAVKVFGHAKNKNITLNEPCAPCYEFIADSKCPYSRKCMTAIHPGMVKAAIEKKLNAEQVSASKKITAQKDIRLWHA